MDNPTKEQLQALRTTTYTNAALEAFKRSLADRKIAVLGFGVSNRALMRFLTESGAYNVYLYDLKADAEAVGNAERLLAEGVIRGYRLGTTYLDELPDGGFELIFRSPSMRPDEAHIDLAVRRGAVLTSEMEVFVEYCPCPIYAITGSDGKTTTTTLTALILREHYKHTRTQVWLGGNIGTPLVDRLAEIEPGDRVVLELSSFQLMHMPLSADAAAITNITPNHLNVHKNYQEYIDCKKAVFMVRRHGGPDAGAGLIGDDPAVNGSVGSGSNVPGLNADAPRGVNAINVPGLNADAPRGVNAINVPGPTARPQKHIVLNAGNPVTAGIAVELAAAGWRIGGEKVVVDVFTAKKPREVAEQLPHNGATAFFVPGEAVDDTPSNAGKIVLRGFCSVCGGCRGRTFEMDREDLLLPGLHNVENLMTAALLVRGEATPEDVYHVAVTFGGVSHRLERVRVLDGVTYINSSIDSSPERTINALSVFPDRTLVMIAGGKDKNLDYAPIGAPIAVKVKTLILIGPTSDKIEASVRAADPAVSVHIVRAATYEAAVAAARAAAVPGDTVLLSPASTSFDLFKNFEERGNTFKQLVLALSET